MSIFSGYKIPIAGILFLLPIIVHSAFSGNVSSHRYNEPIKDAVYAENFRSVQIFRKGWPLSYPIIRLNSNEQILLCFDELDGKQNQYSYELIHCNADWVRSDLLNSDYLEGFHENQIRYFEPSFNTYQDYVHYRIELPNEDLKMTKSGNYALVVYSGYDSDNPVLIRRFYVSEGRASINARLKRPVSGAEYGTSQLIDYSVNLVGINVQNPYTDIVAVISQNNIPQRTRTISRPTMVRGNEIEYFEINENTFKGGNEFRNFDIKSLRYQSQRIKSIEFRRPHNHIVLHPERVRARSRYFFNEDLNGKYHIEIQEGTDSNLDADYVQVHFNLPYDIPEVDGHLYVFGAFNNWKLKEDNKMTYSLENKAYELTLPLKQGYYNYEYVYVRHGTDKPDNSFIEGSFFETENDYIIYIYYKDIYNRYDRLVGVEIFNTIAGG